MFAGAASGILKDSRRYNAVTTGSTKLQNSNAPASVGY
jgi:hypothetical protein